MNLNVSELTGVLRSLKGTTAVTVTTLTPVDMHKTNNPLHGRVTKRSRRNCFVGFLYANSVNNQRTREGHESDFVALPRKWGTRLAGTPLVEHKGALYLECKVQKVIQTEYLVDGAVVSEDEVKPFLKPRKPSTRQGVEREVVLIDPKLENIEQIVMHGQTYEVRAVCEEEPEDPDLDVRYQEFLALDRLGQTLGYW